MARAVKSSSKTSHPSIDRGDIKTRSIGGVIVKPVRPVSKVPADTAARIRDAVRDVYGEKKKS